MLRSILTIDQGTTSGFVITKDGGDRRLSTSWTIPMADTLTRPAKLLAFEGKLSRLIDWIHPELVGFETPSTYSHRLQTAWLLFGFANSVERVCEATKTPYISIGNQSWKGLIFDGDSVRKKNATDAARATLRNSGRKFQNSDVSKLATVNEARNRGWQASDDNEADAHFMMEYLLRHLADGTLTI